MTTRAEYMAGDASHREYYAQFVNPAVISDVVNQIGSERILGSTDPHFNDIPLNRWDRINFFTAVTFKSVGDYPTKAGLVCVAKEAARQYFEAFIGQ